MPEGDTIHRISRRIDAALLGKTLERADAPSPRSPLYRRTAGLEGRKIERSEARGKHLLLHLDDGNVIHNHLGMNGRWRIANDGRMPAGKPWLILASGPGVASLDGSKLLRLTTESKARSDPALLQLGPDPLAVGFDESAAAARVAGWEPEERIGAALLDQRLLAGIGNVIRIEALWQARVSPWRRVGAVELEEAERIVKASRWIMETAVREGRRPKRIYGALARRPCPRCGSAIETRGQGDDNRITYWCGGCQL